MKNIKLEGSGLPKTTMFMLMSIDGKISTGDDEEHDFDADLPKLESTRMGLQHYYDLEKQTAEWTVGSGRTQAKVLKNIPIERVLPTQASAVVVDNHYVNDELLEKLAKKFKGVVLATTRNGRFSSTPSNVVVEYFPSNDIYVPLEPLVRTLYHEYGVRELCLQGGGDLNASFLREGLVDEIHIVVAPLIVGGKTVPGLVGGINPISLKSVHQLDLIGYDFPGNDYVCLRYRVLKNKETT